MDESKELKQEIEPITPTKPINKTSRRQFFRDISKGGLAAVIGTGLFAELDLIANNVITRNGIGVETENLIFEPASHTGTEEEKKELLDKFSRGENAHIWNPEAVLRINNSQPSILSIDSMYTYSSLTSQSIESYNDEVWFHLPDRASNINRKGEIYIVAGDIFNFAPEFGSENVSKIAQPLVSGQFDDATQERLSTAIKPYLGALIAGYLVTHESQNKKLNRRGVLQLLSAGLVTIGLTSLNYGYQKLAAESKDPLLKNLFRSLDEVLNLNAYIRNDIVDGRTALLIEKGIVSHESLKREGILTQDTKLAVIAGFGHNNNSYALMNNPQERLKAIRKLGEAFVDSTRKVFTDLNYSQEEIDNAVNTALNSLAEIQILKVTDSNEQFPIPNIQDYLKKNIHFSNVFVHSNLIESAFAPLRPK